VEELAGTNQALLPPQQAESPRDAVSYWSPSALVKALAGPNGKYLIFNGFQLS
jgi:hypothetical protein